jgi:hypothetical protein
MEHVVQKRPKHLKSRQGEKQEIPGDNLFAARTRHKMRADWDVVRTMLVGDKPRRAADGRDVFQVWADLVLENPPLEYERAMRMFPADPKQTDAGNNTNVSIASLYLQAVVAANRSLDAKIIEAKAAAPGSPGPASDW